MAADNTCVCCGRTGKQIPRGFVPVKHEMHKSARYCPTHVKWLYKTSSEFDPDYAALSAAYWSTRGSR